MNKKTLNALTKSIQKWERFATGTSKETDFLGPEGCPLCKLFLDSNCKGCPVSEKVAEVGCKGTPYDEFDAFPDEIRIESKEFKSMAKRELKFLKSLLPKINKT